MTSVLLHPTYLGPVSSLATANSASKQIYDGAIILVAGYAGSTFFGPLPTDSPPLPQDQVIEPSGPGTRLQGLAPISFTSNGTLNPTGPLNVPLTVQYVNASQFRLNLTAFTLSNPLAATLQNTYMAVNQDWTNPGKPVNVRYAQADQWSLWEWRFDAQWRIIGFNPVYFGTGFMWAREDNFLATDLIANAASTPSNGRIYAPYILRFPAATATATSSSTGTSTPLGSSATSSSTSTSTSTTTSTTASSTATRTATLTASNTNSASSSTSSSSSGLPTAAKVGIGAGAVVILILVIVLLARRKSAPKIPAGPGPPR